MAQRRMFSKEITNSSDFQMMSPSAQALYFHIGMNSDDDGFCEAFTIVRMTESKPDDLSLLHQRGFIFLVDSKVCIVKDWHTNNDIRVDRYSRSKYLDKPQYADVYGIIMEDKVKHLGRYKAMLPSGSTDGSTQVRLGKVSIDYSVADATDSEESEKPTNKEKARDTYEPLLRWAESEHDRKFVNRVKQYTALKQAKGVGLKSVELKERWEEMEGQTFWRDKGFDWTHVVSSFNRKGV